MREDQHQAIVAIEGSGIYQTSEEQAWGELTGYLSRYDRSQIFIDYPEWDVAITYQVDQYLIHDDQFYKCLVENTGQSPDQNLYHSVDNPTGQWVLSDPRAPIIVMRLGFIARYFAMQSLPASKVPSYVATDYDQSILWAKGVAKGTINPQLPLLEVEGVDLGNQIVYGSNKKRRNHG